MIYCILLGEIETVVHALRNGPLLGHGESVENLARSYRLDFQP